MEKIWFIKTVMPHKKTLTSIKRNGPINSRWLWDPPTPSPFSADSWGMAPPLHIILLFMCPYLFTLLHLPLHSNHNKTVMAHPVFVCSLCYRKYSLLLLVKIVHVGDGCVKIYRLNICIYLKEISTDVRFFGNSGHFCTYQQYLSYNK